MAGRLTSKKEEGGIFPTLRKGIISSNHIEILKVSEVEHPQESFIVDCHSTNGYSGAPVLLVIDPSYQRPNKPNFDNIDENSDAIHDDFMKLHSRILGINWGHLPVREKIVKKTFWGFKEFIRPVNSGIMGVIPAWKIQELLNSMKQKKIRKDHDNELTKILQSGEGIAD